MTVYTSPSTPVGLKEQLNSGNGKTIILLSLLDLRRLTIDYTEQISLHDIDDNINMRL